jgi:hypothetical protein
MIAIVESDVDRNRRTAGRTDCLRGGDRSLQRAADHRGRMFGRERRRESRGLGDPTSSNGGSLSPRSRPCTLSAVCP